MWMLDGRRREAWDHTSFLLAKIHNVNCLKRSSMVTPNACHPYRRARRDTPRLRVDVDRLFDIFMAKRKNHGSVSRSHSRGGGLRRGKPA
jgi:hypothetical protein